MRVVRNINQTGKAMAITIHQPGIHIFEVCLQPTAAIGHRALSHVVCVSFLLASPASQSSLWVKSVCHVVKRPTSPCSHSERNTLRRLPVMRNAGCDRNSLVHARMSLAAMAAEAL